MINKSLKGLLILGTVAALGTAAAQDDAMATQAYGDYDANADAAVDMTEFGTTFGTGLFDRFDANGDGVLSQDEINQGVYGWLDTDGNGTISQAEYDAGSQLWMGANAGGEMAGDTQESVSFSDLDGNGDDVLTEDEYAGAPNSEMTSFSSLDADASGGLSEEEFNAGMAGTDMAAGGATTDFASLDTDGNGELSQEELTAANPDGIGGFDLSAGDLTAEQFNNDLFTRLDTNADQTLGEDEFAANQNVFQDYTMENGGN